MWDAWPAAGAAPPAGASARATPTGTSREAERELTRSHLEWAILDSRVYVKSNILLHVGRRDDARRDARRALERTARIDRARRARQPPRRYGASHARATKPCVAHADASAVRRGAATPSRQNGDAADAPLLPKSPATRPSRHRPVRVTPPGCEARSHALTRTGEGPAVKHSARNSIALRAPVVSVRIPLPVLESLRAAKGDLSALFVDTGRQVLGAMMEQDRVATRARPRTPPSPRHSSRISSSAA